MMVTLNTDIVRFPLIRHPSVTSVYQGEQLLKTKFVQTDSVQERYNTHSHSQVNLNNRKYNQ